MPQNEMSDKCSGQTPESIRSDFDRIALLSAGGESWNHNAHYQGYLLSYIPERCRNVLEIGCGGGEFSRLLAARAEKVLAIDLSAEMIRLARERSKLYPNIDFIAGDAMTHQLPDNYFDCIATLTTIHHLPLESCLRKIRTALKPGGVFICLDLYRRSSAVELLFDAAAYPAALLLSLIKTGKPRPSREMREAYAEHGKTDVYPTLPQIKRICADLLPGAAVKRHLLWRYSIVWKKEIAG